MSTSRHYHIPTMPLFKGYNFDWLSLSGSLRRKYIEIDEFESILKKAKRGDYSTVVLAENTLEHIECLELFKLCEFYGLKVRLQLSAQGLLFSIDQWRKVKSANVAVDVILDNLPQDWALIKELALSEPVRFVLPGIKDAPIWGNLKKIPLDVYENLYLYFPYHGSNKKIFKPRQIREKLLELEKLNPQFIPRVLSGLDVYEPRIHERSDLESLVQPVLRTRQEVQPKVSVVIPAYNNGRYVINTLRHLQAQKEGAQGLYEVILVDDGSSDETSELILQTYSTFTFPFTYIYYPRFQKRQMGDSQFRAGLARNLGVKWARAELLAFLDADIIVPPNYILDLLRLHTTNDVVQWRRDYLKKEVPSFTVKYEDVKKESDCFIPEGGYWERFYQDAARASWPELKDYWKYTCTYALSLPKSLFKDVGWFRKTYCFYGFEDTDLGLQLMRKGAKFHFQDVSVYHLFHETGRSEFRNSFFHRQKLLKNTARIFYHNTLDHEAYKVFKYLLSPFF